MSSKDLLLFEKDKLTMKNKFFLLMELLLSNQTPSRLECIIFLGIFYLQTISGFFAEQIEVFDINDSTSDKILNYVEKILRLKDLFIDNYTGFKAVIFGLFAVFVISIIYFIVLIYKTNKDSFYTCTEVLLNFYIKIIIYVAFNIILDLTLSNLCFESDDKNPNFNEASCKITNILPVFIISVLLLLMAIFFAFFIQIFYCDSMYLSTSYYAKISCNYELYINLSCIFYSVFLIYAKYLGREIFLIYNLIISVVFLSFYLKRYLFYDKITNLLVGLFHVLYVWTSVFFLLFAFIDFQEKGIIYLISSAIVIYFYFNLRTKVEEDILLNVPFYKITNKYHLLYYLKNLIDKINNYEENPKEKVLLNGIIQMHALECPNPNCLSRTKNKIYLPVTNEWSDRTKPLMQDKVFLMNVVLIIMNYFLVNSYYSPEMIINISLYYLQIIGNFCKALYYYKKVKEMKLTLQEQFSLVRLELAISKALVEKFKQPNETCFSLEDLNVTMYFKYEDLSQNFFDEMNNDVNYSLEFWRSFYNAQVDPNKTIDFNKIFLLTDKIRITKAKVEKIWAKLIKIFNGVNELYDLYIEYIEQIKDDDNLKRELESTKRKNENSADLIQQNFYSVLFNKETGIIIANGDKGKEGLIEKVNNEVENIFKYKPEELKGMNLNMLMPKIFEKNHKSYMEKYFEIGEKKVIDAKDMKSFAKDKDNSIIMVRLAMKLFPMLNESVYFVGMIVKENIDDIIFIDSNFNIQGMSMKLMKILQIENKNLFQDNEIPFYVICKKFVNFYRLFFRGHNRGRKDKKQKSSLVDETSSINNIVVDFSQKENDNKDNELQDNFEVTENTELEYEIRLPQFLIDYSTSTAKKEQKNELKLLKTITTEEQKEEGIISSAKDTIDDYGESDLLVDEENQNLTNNVTGNSNINQTNMGKTPLETPGKNNETPTPTPNPNTPTPGLTFKGNTPGNTPNENLINEEERVDFNKQSDEEKEFKTKIDKHVVLFEDGKFNELEQLIDEYAKESNFNDFKFNIAFDIYKYGEKQRAYVIRCIDNKNEGGDSDEETVGENVDPKVAKYKKEKAEAIKYLIQVTEEERNQMVSQLEQFNELNKTDKTFQALLNVCKEDIIKMSMVHGQKKDEVVIDENASQTSQSGFNADLCKKNRIEEIRANIMKNVANFYTLKYIKILVLFTALLAVVYCVLYIIFFNGTYKDLNTVSDLNIQLFQSTIWTSNLLSTLISLRTIYEFSLTKGKFNFNAFYPPADYIPPPKEEECLFKTCPYLGNNLNTKEDEFNKLIEQCNTNTTIQKESYCKSVIETEEGTEIEDNILWQNRLMDNYCNNTNPNCDKCFDSFKFCIEGTHSPFVDTNHTVYFEYMQQLGTNWYNNIISAFGELENKIGAYIKEDDEYIFWGNHPVTYHQSVDISDIKGDDGKKQDTESFPLSIGQVLSGVNSLLKNNDFSSVSNNTENDESDRYIKYLGFISIENAYSNLLPNQFDKLTTIPEIFKDWNKNSIKIFLYVLIIYACLMVVICIVYSLLLFITNKNMGEGLEKVTKIKLEKIEETIKRIEGFNETLKKHRDKENNKSGSEENKDSNQQNPNDKNTATGPNTTQGGNTSSNMVSSASSGFSNDDKKHKSLKILSYSYLQTIVIVIVLCGFLIPIYILINGMINSTNKLIDVQAYLFGKLLISSASTVKVKCMMSECTGITDTNELDYSVLENRNEIQAIVQGITIFDELNDFYNQKFLLNACQTAFDEVTQPDLFKICTDSPIVLSANNTDSLLKIVDYTVDNIYKDRIMKTNMTITYNGIPSDFRPKMLYDTPQFLTLENIFYYFITPVSDNFAKVFQSSLDDYLSQKKTIMLLLIILFGVIMIAISLYIAIFFVDRLIHLLSVSRCILKIIPTTVINSTQELENWIENK
ncbi:MAG: PAS domain S-box protein, partial [archaeon]|nr:PAS domain S-box protein [archaeon]